jgi:hypothetical protein
MAVRTPSAPRRREPHRGCRSCSGCSAVDDDHHRAPTSRLARMAADGNHQLAVGGVYAAFQPWIQVFEVP